MGAWGTKSFDNDSALDWAEELMGSNDLKFVEETIRIIIDSEYIDASEGEEALAAIEVVASLHGNPENDLPEELVEWINNHNELDYALVDLSRKAIRMILSDESELKELWIESENYEKWLNDIKNLEIRLQD